MKINTFISLSLYLASIFLYLEPISKNRSNNGNSLIHNPTPTLDEIYFTLDGDNNDVKLDPGIRTPIAQVFRHDYWGRDMNSQSSHKSYRPITVLSFRGGYFIADLLRMNGLFFQRVVNILIHAVLVQMVGKFYECLFHAGTDNTHAQSKNGQIERALVMVLFMLHPTHIESVVNIANRAHLLSLMFTLVSLDLSLHASMTGIMYAMGLLSCETSIFLFPAICISWICIDLNKESGEFPRNIIHCMKRRLPRLILISTITFAYLFTRHYLDWIHIPRGLIRPAENPFYSISGVDRLLNYSFILSIHVIKSLGMGIVDLVGFSHEYGFDCVKRIVSLQDGRIWIPVVVAMVLFYLLLECNKYETIDHKTGKVYNFMRKILLFFGFVSWMASLFPVSGFIRVGTFIADRIVIASTVASSILWTRTLAPHFYLSEKNSPSKIQNSEENKDEINTPCTRRNVGSKYIALLLLLGFLWIKVQTRSKEWMCPVELLRSSLRACPRCAKSNLEMGKVFMSGLFDETKDLNKALYHVQLAEEIDPDFCDVHYQFSHIYALEGKYFEFEDRITKAVLCQFTMQGAHNMFQQYWGSTLNDPAQVEKGAKERYGVQLKIIQDAIAREAENEAKLLQNDANDKDAKGNIIKDDEL